MHKDKEGPAPINFFRPRPGYMRRGVIFVTILFLAWALLTFGFQFLLVLTSRDEVGQGPLTDATFLGFPFHFWFSGQFLILWFILLCLFYNLFRDHLRQRYDKRRRG